MKGGIEMKQLSYKLKRTELFRISSGISTGTRTSIWRRNFLRAFVDYFIDVMNEKAGFNSKVVLCQPIAPGLADMINEQEGLYTLFLRGFQDGQKVNKKRIISCVSRCLNPYQDFEPFLTVLQSGSEIYRMQHNRGRYRI